MNYLIYGQENYLIKNKINELIKDFDSLSVTKCDYTSKGFNILNIIDQANTIDFFNSQKAIIIDNCSFLRAKGKLEDEHTKLLDHYLANSNPDTTMIFVLNLGIDEKIDSRKKLYKSMVKYCQHHIFSQLEHPEFIRYTETKLKELNIDIAADAKKELFKRLPNDLSNLHNELDKMTLYGDHFNLELIKTIIVPLYEEKIFELINCIVRRNRSLGIVVFNDLLQQSDDPIALIYQLAAQFRFMFKVKTLINKGYTKQDIIQELKQNPYYIDNTMKSCSHIRIDDILRFNSGLSELDVLFKTDSNLNRKLALEMYVIKELS